MSDVPAGFKVVDAVPKGFKVVDEQVTSIQGSPVTSSMIQPEFAQERTLLDESDAGVTLTPEAFKQFQDFQRQTAQEKQQEAQREASLPRRVERVGESAKEGFQQGEDIFRSALEATGLDVDAPNINFLQRASRDLQRAGLAAGTTTLGAIASGVNALGQDRDWETLL